MISAIQYLMTSYGRKDYNSIHLNPVRITYKFDAVEDNPQQVFQTITYTFKGENRDKEPIINHIMLLSKSIFCEFGNIEINAKARMESGFDKPLTVKRGRAVINMQQIEVLFDDCIAKNEIFEFSIELKWKQPYFFKEVEYFIIDPWNYSLDVAKIIVTIDTDSDYFENSVIYMYEADRQTMKKKTIANMPFRKQENNRWNIMKPINPRKDSIYLLNISTP